VHNNLTWVVVWKYELVVWKYELGDISKTACNLCFSFLIWRLIIRSYCIPGCCQWLGICKLLFVTVHIFHCTSHWWHWRTDIERVTSEIAGVIQWIGKVWSLVSEWFCWLVSGWASTLTIICTSDHQDPRYSQLAQFHLENCHLTSVCVWVCVYFSVFSSY